MENNNGFNYMKLYISGAIVGLIVLAGGAYFYKAGLNNGEQIACTMEAKICPDGSAVGRSGPKCEFTECPAQKELIYTNTEYGLRVALPVSWQGYTVLLGTREIRNVSTNALVASAPTISIRDPLWTAQIPRQDIPIDVYTLPQWTNIIAGKYSVSATPISPSELARNSKYVFALPARYKYAFPEGFQEVEQIIADKPITAFEPNSNTNNPPTILPYSSGVNGTVLLGPTCPVIRNPPDPACADRGYATTINVRRDGSNSVFATGKSDASGVFKFSLPPGAYTISATGGTMLPRCSDVSVTVSPNIYTKTTISCDTGIRQGFIGKNTFISPNLAL